MVLYITYIKIHRERESILCIIKNLWALNENENGFWAFQPNLIFIPEAGQLIKNTQRKEEEEKTI